MATILDRMEYASNALARAAYPNNNLATDLLNENCSDISDWTDADKGTGVSEVSPAGQFRFDTNLGAAGNDYAYRYRVITSPPDRFVLTLRLYCDDIGTSVAVDYFQLTYMTDTWQLRVHFASDGLFVYKAGGAVGEVGTNIVQEGVWQLWRFEVDKTAGEGNATVEVFLGGVSQGTVDCDYVVAGVDGKVWLLQRGYTTNNMVSHTDYIQVGGTDILCYSESSIKVQGSYSLKAIAITGSVNSTLTRTIGSPVNLSNIDKLYLAIRASRTGSNIKVGIRDSGTVWTEITPNIASGNTWQGVEWDISGVSNANKNSIDRIRFTVVNDAALNTFYIDNMREGWEVLSHTLNLGFVPSQVSTVFGVESMKLGFVPSFVLGPLGLSCILKLGFVPSQVSTVHGIGTKKLGFVPSQVSITTGELTKQLGFVPGHISTTYGELLKQLGFVSSHISTVHGTLTKQLGFVIGHSSIIYGILTKQLGFVPEHVSTTYGTLLKKLGFVPSHSSMLYGTELLKLGFIPSHSSILYGVLTKKLGFIPIHVSKVYKYIVELKFYDRDDNLVKIISSKTKNFPLVDPPGLDFQWFRDGGCGPFSFAVSEDLGLEYNYKCEIYLWETKWFSGYITKLPQTVGTQIIFNYAGWGFSEQIDWQTIKETYVGTEISAIAEDILDNYIIGKTKVKKAA